MLAFALLLSPQAYSVDHNEQTGQTGASLDFVIPRDVTDGFVNNRRESYRFRYS